VFAEPKVRQKQGSQSPVAEPLLAQVLEPENLVRALRQVKRNKGAAGVHGTTVAMLPEYLKAH
jgi:hypothetical protein